MAIHRIIFIFVCNVSFSCSNIQFQISHKVNWKYLTCKADSLHLPCLEDEIIRNNSGNWCKNIMNDLSHCSIINRTNLNLNIFPIEMIGFNAIELNNRPIIFKIFNAPINKTFIIEYLLINVETTATMQIIYNNQQEIHKLINRFYLKSIVQSENFEIHFINIRVRSVLIIKKLDIVENLIDESTVFENIGIVQKYKFDSKCNQFPITIKGFFNSSGQTTKGRLCHSQCIKNQYEQMHCLSSLKMEPCLNGNVNEYFIGHDDWESIGEISLLNKHILNVLQINLIIRNTIANVENSMVGHDLNDNSFISNNSHQNLTLNFVYWNWFNHKNDNKATLKVTKDNYLSLSDIQIFSYGPLFNYDYNYECTYGSFKQLDIVDKLCSILLYDQQLIIPIKCTKTFERHHLQLDLKERLRKNLNFCANPRDHYYNLHMNNLNNNGQFTIFNPTNGEITFNALFITTKVPPFLTDFLVDNNIHYETYIMHVKMADVLAMNFDISIHQIYELSQFNYGSSIPMKLLLYGVLKY